jgi:hypothetical protein
MTTQETQTIHARVPVPLHRALRVFAALHDMTVTAAVQAALLAYIPGQLADLKAGLLTKEGT